MDTRFTIHQPIWKGRKGNECFGIVTSRLLGDGFIDIECDYTNKNGDKPFPHIYRMHKSTARSYPVNGRMGVPLHIIPISAFQEVVKV